MKYHNTINVATYQQLLNLVNDQVAGMLIDINKIYENLNIQIQGLSKIIMKNNVNPVTVKTKKTWHVIYTKQRFGGKGMHELTVTTQYVHHVFAVYSS